MPAIRPKVIVTLGKIATQALLGTKEPITKMRGQWQRYDHIRVMPTFHPSYLLRFPKERHQNLGRHAAGDGVPGGRVAVSNQ